MKALTNPISARPQYVATALTALVAGWFFLSAGAIFADGTAPGASASTPSFAQAAGPFSRTAQGRLKVTVVANAGEQPAVSSGERFKMTVVAQRPVPASVNVRTAAMHSTPKI